MGLCQKAIAWFNKAIDILTHTHVVQSFTQSAHTRTFEEELTNSTYECSHDFAHWVKKKLQETVLIKQVERVK
jgi:hypothetical protein